MPKREYKLHFKCSHEGCAEHVTYRYDTMKDRTMSFENRIYGGGAGWKCLRHSSPDRVLSESNPETHFEVISRQESYGSFFGNNGLVTGPGFLAYAADLPAGTKLIISARIELPDAAATGEKT